SDYSPCSSRRACPPGGCFRSRWRSSSPSRSPAPRARADSVPFVPWCAARSSSARKQGAKQPKGVAMKYLMLVCWDAERMNAQVEPDPNDPPEEGSFPWLDEVEARGIRITGDQLAPPRRARTRRV